MLYSVKEVAILSNTTVKTLYHYHKIGLITPNKVTDKGYRLYGIDELKKLQQILFYKELDFSLTQIKDLMNLNSNSSRLNVLLKQKEMLVKKENQLKEILNTITKTINTTKGGLEMDAKQLFEGFKNEKEWQNALSKQNEYLKEKYDTNILEQNSIDVSKLNDMAKESIRFQSKMIEFLKNNVPCNNIYVKEELNMHLEFLNNHGHKTTKENFLNQTEFFINDEFHRNMLESQQIGLSYYLNSCAREFSK